jgi:PKD repeat protein
MVLLRLWRNLMRRVLLIFGCLALSLGLLVIVLAGSVLAVDLGQGVGEPVVHVVEGGTAVWNGGPAIEFNKTVGLDPSVCATESQLTIPSGGGTVYYCYNIEITGDVTMTLHTVVDDKLGIVLGPSFPFTLTPGALAFFTITTNITQTTVNSATWRAFNPGPTDVVTGSDTALVKVEGPILALTATNDGPTAIGRETTLGTFIVGGGFETYDWDFGDGITGTGALTTHIYPAIGVYTAVVTATNAFNSMTATTVVMVNYRVSMPAVFRP